MKYHKPPELKPGDAHPDHPEWRLEKVVHSPDHPKLIKYQWVRCDGERAQLNGFWPTLFPPRVTANKVTGTWAMGLATKIPQGPDDPELRTVRYVSGLPNYNNHPDGEPLFPTVKGEA